MRGQNPVVSRVSHTGDALTKAVSTILSKQGPVMRVRAGPFPSRDAAEKVLQQLRDLGLKPGSVATKS